MANDYLKTETARMTLENGKEIELLWGDLLRDVVVDGTTATVTARGRRGTVAASALGGKSLLEFYFIDVGQGDGVLIKTPDNRHLLIDAGYNRAKQPTGKNAADFVDWKFVKDYGKELIELDVMMTSHNDADHYGGLWDLLDPSHTSQEELDAKGVRVENFYHAGVGWWKNAANDRWLGAKKTVAGKKYLTQLMTDRASIQTALAPGSPDRLQGEWADFMKCMTDTVRKDLTPTPISRLSHKSGLLPGFGTNNTATGRVAIEVLGPVEYDVDGAPALRYFTGGDDKSTNGNSILLRLDYGRARFLLTGDLNKASQHALIEKYQGKLEEFECDVAKSCHHGSDDVSYKFLSLLKAAVTVISSGDAEGHDHPRPNIVGASAVTGYFQVDPNKDELLTPLIYSTEIARSLAVGRPEKLQIRKDTPEEAEITGAELDKATLECATVAAGALRPTKKNVRLNDQSRVVTDLIYGLVNIRTDGDTILCATLSESKYKWQIKKLRSRFI